ncbi:uncharacterized protein DUF932 [Kushneria indalinina DSM 14324]|uniref:Uncharacterized protein DUF932 n=2 Tax=Kushneria indalinina TaxID=184067 RepID=A0A3D9E0Y9_9GAMM|nr:DUF932 domain-containing protein [Kushneria indalinina]REC96671.1 uncharacterized protein DUF932 [Kushneria indalinina DSM 14324]
MLASNFSNRARTLQSTTPLSNDQIQRVAPSIFAGAAHESRSDRYAYIPTIDVLEALRGEGFEPFFACQTATRKEGRQEHTKHMLRLRHASQIVGKEVNEIILLNSHDGTSSYQMLAGCFRFVCANGMVIGDTAGDVRVRHTGEATGEVIEGAYEVLNHMAAVDEQRESMKSVQLKPSEQRALASAALSYRWEDKPAPVTEDAILMPRRSEDRGADLWSTFNRVQENMLRGGLRGRNQKGRPTRTREMKGIDSSVRMNRALWVLSEQLREAVS